MEFWHPEGWLVDGFEWPWPAHAVAPREAVLERADELGLDLSEPGHARASASDGRAWLRGWPEFHVLDVDMPHVPVACPRTDGGHVVATGPGRGQRAARRQGLGGLDLRPDRGPDRRLRVRVHLPRGRGRSTPRRSA